MKHNSAQRALHRLPLEAVIHILRLFLGILPEEDSRHAWTWSWLWNEPFFKRELEITRTQLAYVQAVTPALTLPSPISRFPQFVFAHVGELIVEVLLMNRLLKSLDSADPKITMSGDETPFRLAAEKKGFVAISAHFGCFELLAAYFIKRGIPLCTLGRVSNYGSLDVVIRDLRNSYGTRSIWRDEPDAGLKLLTALRSGYPIAALIDQDTALENAFSIFFGLDTAYPVAPLVFALRYKLPIFSAFITRTGTLRHHIIVEPIAYGDSSPENAIDSILSTYNKRLEQLILSHPEQWIWWHRRWRRPGFDYRSEPELLPSTKAYLTWLQVLTGAIHLERSTETP